MAFTYLPFQTRKPSTSLRSRSWNQKDHENLQHINLSHGSRKHSRMVARRLEEQGAHATREEESPCHLTLCIHWKPRVIPLGITRLKWPSFAGHVAPSFRCTVDGISGTVRYPALFSSSTCWAILSIYVYWRWTWILIPCGGSEQNITLIFRFLICQF